MRRTWIHTLSLVALLALGLAGCQDAGPLVGPELAGTERPLASSSADLAVAEETSSITGGVSAMIGAEGGTLSLGLHSIVVPAGAVDAPTEFRMKKSGAKLQVTLTATQTTTNDVGTAGFAKPVRLVFGYGNVASLPADPSEIVIVWIRPDGTYEPQPTTVDTQAKTVSAEISHFSDYAMATM